MCTRMGPGQRLDFLAPVANCGVRRCPARVPVVCAGQACGVPRVFAFTFMMSAMAASEDTRLGLREPRRFSAACWALLPRPLPGAGGSATGSCVLGGLSWPVPFHTGCRGSRQFPESQLPWSLPESRLDPTEAADQRGTMAWVSGPLAGGRGWTSSQPPSDAPRPVLGTCGFGSLTRHDPRVRPPSSAGHFYTELTVSSARDLLATGSFHL